MLYLLSILLYSEIVRSNAVAYLFYLHWTERTISDVIGDKFISFLASHLNFAWLWDGDAKKVKEFLLSRPYVLYDMSTSLHLSPSFLYQNIWAKGFPPWDMQDKVTLCPIRIVSPSLYSRISGGPGGSMINRRLELYEISDYDYWYSTLEIFCRNVGY